MSDGTPFLRVAADRIGAPGSPATMPFRATNAANWSSIIRIGAKLAVIRRRIARRAVSSHTQRAGRVPYGESRLRLGPVKSQGPHMILDDPEKQEFASWRSYVNFASRVRRTRRYVWEPEVKAFMDTVLATLRGRDVEIMEGQLLFRAQRGVDRGEEEGHDRGSISAFGPTRMKPQIDRATEGRANPTGIPVLYLASSEQTAISEVRPWIGSELSVAQFRIVSPIYSARRDDVMADMA